MGDDYTIYDFVRAAGSTRELAIFLGIPDQHGAWRVSQWRTRGVIPRSAKFEYAKRWAKLIKKMRGEAV